MKTKKYTFKTTIEVEEIQKSPEFWYYVVIESPYFRTTHRYTYHSTNLLALQNHRKKTLERLEDKDIAAYKPSFCKGIEVKPTIFERIMAKKEQKIK